MASSPLGPGKNKTTTPRRTARKNTTNLRKTVLKREHAKRILEMHINQLQKQLSAALELRRKLGKRPRKFVNMNESSPKRRLFNENN